MAKIEENIECEMKIFAQSLQKAAEEKKNLLDKEYRSKMNALKSSNEFKLSQSTNEIKSILHKHEMQIKEIESTQESTIKGLQIKHNLDNNQILKVQKDEIEKLKQKHEEYLVDVQQSMECDI